MVPLRKVCHHTATTVVPLQCQSLLDEGSLHGAGETLCAVCKNVLGEEEHGKSGLLQEESVSGWVFFANDVKSI